MFEQFLPNRSGEARQEKKEREAENRQMDFSREQMFAGSATQPEDDNTYTLEQERRSDLIRWQQELEPEMLGTVLSFLSLRKNDKGKVVPIMLGKKTKVNPMCNKLFIYQVVIPKLKPFISKNLINSNLSEKEILLMQRTTADDIANMMSDNWDKYGIDFVNFDGIFRDLKNVIKASIWRSYKGWTKKVDSSMIKRIEQESYGREETTKKKFNLFNPN